MLYNNYIIDLHQSLYYLFALTIYISATNIFLILIIHQVTCNQSKKGQFRKLPDINHRS